MQVMEGKITAEGRVVVPAPIRHALGVAAGDRIQFLVDDSGHVRLVTPRLLREQLWANNQPEATTAAEPHELVRSARLQDQQDDRRGNEMLDQPADDIADDVLALLGL